MTADEAARSEAERRWPKGLLSDRAVRAMRREFVAGARWQRDHPDGCECRRCADGPWQRGQSQAVTVSREQVEDRGPVRPTWDEYGLALAKAASVRGDCSRRQVGAVILSADNRVIAAGYNGYPSGTPGCLDGACPRAYTDATPGTNYLATGCKAIHAEENALLWTSREDREGGTLYVSEEPCENCTRLIAGSGIARVVYKSSFN